MKETEDNPSFGGYTPEAIRDMTPADVDPMNLSYWYDHQVGADGKMYTLVRDMDGNILGATTGDNNNNNNSGKVATNEEKSTDDKGNGGSQKPDETMTLSQANEWAHNGNGEGVYMDFTKIILPKSVTVERFNESKLTVQRSKAIYVKFDGKDFVNPNQALVYGTITLVLIGKNTVWAMPDKYDFDIKNKPGTFWRDIGTIMGGLFSELQFGVNGQPFKGFPIYFMGTQNIPDK